MLMKSKAEVGSYVEQLTGIQSRLYAYIYTLHRIRITLAECIRGNTA